jgi:hypothetical protein
MTTTRTSCSLFEAEWILSGGLRSDELVYVLNENGDVVGLAIYLGTVRPYQLGLDWEDLMVEFDLVPELAQLKSRSIPVPTEWHHSLILEGRPIHLSTTHFTLLPAQPPE